MGGSVVASAYRIGTGFDFHRLASGRKLMLGGVEVPFDQGLVGHSDADVVLHAVCDAILGALGLGDIGRHFPDTDSRYKNVSSLTLVQEVASKMVTAGFGVGNLDVTILAERPRIASHVPSMRRRISEALGCQEGAINIKATTLEGAGSIGRGEGIAAQAVVLLVTAQGA